MAGDSPHDPVRQIARRLFRGGFQGIAQNAHFRKGETRRLTLQQQQISRFAISLRPDRQIFAVFLESFQKGR